MSGYVTFHVGQIKYMYFLIEDDDLLEKYNIVWDKVSADVKKELDREDVHNKIFLKSYGDEVTDFYDKKIPEMDSNHTCLAIINWDCAIKKAENYYRQILTHKYTNKVQIVKALCGLTIETSI